MQTCIKNSGIPKLFDTAPTHIWKLQDKALIKSNRLTQILLISSHKGHLEYRIQLVRAWKNYSFPLVKVYHLKRGHQLFLYSLCCEPP